MQWGDEGKGKMTDALMRTGDYQISVRVNGSGNAGHTVTLPDGTKKAVHLLPAGAFAGDVTAALGRSMVVDLKALLGEIGWVRAVNPDLTVWVDPGVHLVLPYDRLLDAAREDRRGASLGTTRTGNGPAYAHKAERIGVTLADALYVTGHDWLREQVGVMAGQAANYLGPDWAWGAEGAQTLPKPEDVADDLIRFAMELREVARVTDVGRSLNRALDYGSGILFCVAHGTLLDIDHGTYPYVTSSTCTSGAVSSCGFSLRRVTNVIGLAKAYITRIGTGPFPTEMEPDLAGVVRRAGHEYGSTTGRPRRIGWPDLGLLAYATEVNAVDEIALTMTDVLGVLTSWKLGARDWEPLRPAAEYEKYKPSMLLMPKLEATMETIAACQTYEELPYAVQWYVGMIEKATGVKVTLISNGPEADALIARQEE
jgi:adenylosuccinate synthase